MAALKAVVLAAGDGGRLGNLTAQLPKPLLPVAGKPLIQYTLDALSDAGIDDTVVVTGYRESDVRAALTAESGASLRFASNPHYHAGQSLSVQAAREHVEDEPFVLTMADHLLSPELLTDLLAQDTHTCIVGADFAPPDYHDTLEATRIRLDPRSGDPPRVAAIGKQLTSFDALDTGAFLLTPRFWEAVDASPVDCELALIFRELVHAGELRAADVSGAFWFDVDTAADLAVAQELVGGATEVA